MKNNAMAKRSSIIKTCQYSIIILLLFSLIPAMTMGSSIALSMSGVDEVYSEYGLTGNGVKVAIFDNGTVANHVDLSEANIINLTQEPVRRHATMTAGLIASTGEYYPRAKGVASQVTLYSYVPATHENFLGTWPDLPFDWHHAAVDHGVYINTTSGSISFGWQSATIIDEGVEMGAYTWTYGSDSTLTRGGYGLGIGLADSDLYVHEHYDSEYGRPTPAYLVIVNSGNDRVANGSGSPHKHRENLSEEPLPGWFTCNHPPNTTTGYGTIPTYFASMKNAIVVGSVDDNRKVSDFSNTGPTMDGRIKPDIVARGGVYQESICTLDDENGMNCDVTGTSVSTPHVAGIAALITQAYLEWFDDGLPPASFVKALLLHTADDVENPGPDYLSGFGLVNAKRAVDTLKDIHENNGRSRWLYPELYSNQTRLHTLTVEPDMSSLKATMVWTDLGKPLAEFGEDALWNQLDMRLISPGGKIHYPYILDKDAPWLDATTGRNVVDNVEQVFVDQPEAGEWTIEVKAVGMLGFDDGEDQFYPTQIYSLILSTEPQINLDWLVPVISLILN